MMPASFMPHLYQDLPPIGNKLANRSTEGNANAHSGPSSMDLNISTSMIPSFGSKLGLLLPDPAPDVAPNLDKILSTTTNTQLGVAQTSTQFKWIKSIKYQSTRNGKHFDVYKNTENKINIYDIFCFVSA